jgi:hypothetical protein
MIAFGLHEKINNGKKWNSATSGRHRRISTSQIPTKFAEIKPNTAGLRLYGRNSATAAGHRSILAKISRFQHRSVSKSGNGRLFEHEGWLHHLKEGRLHLASWEKWFMLLKSVNHFRKLTRHFLSNGITEIVFQLTIIFAPTKHRKIPK